MHCGWDALDFFLKKPFWWRGKSTAERVVVESRPASPLTTRVVDRVCIRSSPKKYGHFLNRALPHYTRWNPNFPIGQWAENDTSITDARLVAQSTVWIQSEVLKHMADWRKAQSVVENDLTLALHPLYCSVIASDSFSNCKPVTPTHFICWFSSLGRFFSCPTVE